MTPMSKYQAQKADFALGELESKKIERYALHTSRHHSVKLF